MYCCITLRNRNIKFSCLGTFTMTAKEPMDHIAFVVDDIDETFTMRKNERFTIPEDQPVFLNFWERGSKYFYIIGPDGERLEFCQVL